MSEEPDDDEGSEQRFTLALFIIHPDIDPTELTERIGLLPKYSGRAGDQRRTAQGAPLPSYYRDTRWRYVEAHSVTSQHFRRELETFIGRLQPHRALFHRLRETGGSLTLIISFLGDRGHFGDNLPVARLAELADLQIDLGIEVYTVPQNVDQSRTGGAPAG